MNELRTLPVKKVRRPKICLRPLRRNTLEYVELAASIAEHGVLQPILVRPGLLPSEYEIVDGWHRHAGAKEAGLKEIDCLVRDMTDREVLIYQLVCNSMGPETRTFEYARRLKLLMEDGYTLGELSDLIKKNPEWIKRNLQLARLCKEARKPVERGEILMTAALALANLPSQLQTKFVDDAITMSAAEFCRRAKAALRDFKAYLLRVQQEDRVDGAANPRLRSISSLKQESVDRKQARAVLKAAKAETALDGWKACLAWVFRLDPLSVKRRKSQYKEKSHHLTTEEDRHMNREMIRQFVTSQPRIRRPKK